MNNTNEMKQVAVPSVEQVENELKKIRYKDLFRKTLSSTVATLIVVAAIAVLISTLFLPVIQVSGNSMEPSLKDGDILVLVKTDKCDYGDLCCVSWQNKLLLKRVIGLPGDSITIDSDGNVYVNDELLDEPYITEKSQGNCEIEFPFTVPDNRIFILGDARESSVDSRSSAIGCIEQEQIIGTVLWNVWNAK
ncbi:MAG: signal peptidase I [Oscillospiraceae bacterium]|nr:signal peptidase I [Oscillospiraceae bacterium]